MKLCARRKTGASKEEHFRHVAELEQIEKTLVTLNAEHGEALAGKSSRIAELEVELEKQ